MRKRSEYKGGDNRRKPSKERQVTVGESNTLLPFLFELLKEQSRSSVKGLEQGTDLGKRESHPAVRCPAEP